MKTSDSNGIDYSSDAAEVTAALRTTPCVLEQILVTNDTSTAGWVQLHDSADAPSSSAVPKLRFPLPADPGCISLDFPKGIRFRKGCYAVISTARGTYTASSNAAWFYAVLSNASK